MPYFVPTPLLNGKYRMPRRVSTHTRETSSLETVRGVVEVITFHNEENGFVVAKLAPETGGSRIAVKGNIRHINVGEIVVMRGYWVNDRKYGPTFVFESYESVMPSSREGIIRFLSSKYMEGIGPVLAERIVKKFGEDTFDILDNHPERLKKVKGLSPKKVTAVVAGWQAHRKIRDIMVFLRANDISETYASRIYEKYGDNTVHIMKTDPYRLIRDMRGIGFIKADQIAKKIGLEPDAPERIRAGVIFTLDEFTDAGHMFTPLEKLVESATATLSVDTALVMEQLGVLRERREIIVDDDRVYLHSLHRAEMELSQRLKLVADTPRPGKIPGAKELSDMVAAIEKERSVSFAPLQRDSIVRAAASKLLILTGGPGTGKTTTVLGIIGMFRKLRMSVLLCAPTGRAAKRLAETTGMEAKTIHRLLEFNPHTGLFNKNEGEPLDAHAVIMDEASMVDTELMNNFLRAVSEYTTLVIVGDVDQLPSIGPGNVLRDMIDSGRFPTIRLTEIFRQAASSRIVRCAHLINEGAMPLSDNDVQGNFFIIKKKIPAEAAESIVDLVVRRLPKKYGYDPFDDIQVLSPMHKSETGVASINALLQEQLNPKRPGCAELFHGSWTYRLGDRVMQIRNNYDKLVFNGDIGRIEKIDREKNMVWIRYDDLVEYQKDELSDVVPAYAVSVHKSQGSEFRCVVMPVTTQHFIMLRRNLLYTAVTRARELAVLVGDMKAIAIAVGNGQVSERCTTLREMLSR